MCSTIANCGKAPETGSKIWIPVPQPGLGLRDVGFGTLKGSAAHCSANLLGVTDLVDMAVGEGGADWAQETEAINLERLPPSCARLFGGEACSRYRC